MTEEAANYLGVDSDDDASSRDVFSLADSTSMVR